MPHTRESCAILMIHADICEVFIKDIKDDELMIVYQPSTIHRDEIHNLLYSILKTKRYKLYKYDIRGMYDMVYSNCKSLIGKYTEYTIHISTYVCSIAI